MLNNFKENKSNGYHLMFFATILSVFCWTLLGFQNIQAAPAFTNPDLFDANSGAILDLKVVPSLQTIDGKNYCLRTYSYNGNPAKLVGPTILIARGNSIKMNLTNTFTRRDEHSVGINKKNTDFNTTNFHTHGLHVSPEMSPVDPTRFSDNVLISICPQIPLDGDNTAECVKGPDGQIASVVPFQFDLDEEHVAGTMWYHPHVHGATSIQLANGMAGALIITGDVDEIPGIKGAKDNIFVFQQIPYQVGRPLADGETCDQLNLSINQFNLVYNAEKTFINGLWQPQLEISPGEVQRWRFIHAGISRQLIVSLIKADNSGSCQNPGTETLNLFEFARDGITMAAGISQENVILYPGYRDDVMVKMPDNAGGIYCLWNLQATAAERLRGDSSGSDQLLATVVVNGSTLNMSLPSDSNLAEVALPPISCTESLNTKSQIMTFAQQWSQTNVDNMCEGQVSGVPFYNVNCKQFNSDEPPRELALNATQEWELSTEYDSHPFHIHVNPFTVCQENGVTVSTPYWRDTLFLPTPPSNGTRGPLTLIRSEYTDFTGKFVLHCHKLDHEDQGMMQIVDIINGAN